MGAKAGGVGRKEGTEWMEKRERKTSAMTGRVESLALEDTHENIICLQNRRYGLDQLKLEQHSCNSAIAQSVNDPWRRGWKYIACMGEYRDSCSGRTIANLYWFSCGSGNDARLALQVCRIVRKGANGPYNYRYLDGKSAHECGYRWVGVNWGSLPNAPERYS
jgi:hypothetical protein